VQPRQRTKNEALPLIAQRLAGNVAALFNGIVDTLPQCWHAVRKLHRDARNELACMADVAAVAREEEAGCETLPVVVPARDRPRDCRLTRPCQAAQPEDASLVLSLSPVVYLVEEANARVGEADRLVLLGVRVKGCVFGVRETTEGILKL